MSTIGARKLLLFGGSGLPAPALDLNFLLGTLDPAVTFTRAAGPATYFDSTGTLQTAGTNVARFDYDPATRAPRGLLIEEVRTNNLPTAIPDNTAWLSSNATVTLNQTAAPDGTSTASLLVDNAVSANHSSTANATFAFVSATTYAFSIFAKAATASGLQIWFPSAAFSNAFANFDLSAGTVGTSSGGTAAIQACANGWYRCSFALAATGSSTVAAFIVGTNGNNSSAVRAVSYVGTGTGVYVWGAQMETGAFPTSYIPTTAGAATRAAETAVVASTPAPATGTLWAETLKAQVQSRAGTIVGYTGGGTKTSLNVSAGNAVTMFDTTGAINASLGSEPIGTVYRAAFAFSAGSQRGCLNGGAVTSTSAASLSATTTTLSIGNEAGLVQADAWIRRVRTWNIMLSGSQLQAATR